MNDKDLASALGWFSIGLGLTELIAGQRLSRALGLEPYGGAALVRAFGAREVANGMMILQNPAESSWLWARVGGDAADLGVLGAAALDPQNRKRDNAGLALAAVAGVTLLDIACAAALGREEARARRTAQRTRVHRSPQGPGLARVRSGRPGVAHDPDRRPFP